MIERAYLVLGSNIEDRVDYLASARASLEALGEEFGASGLYCSGAYGYVEQPDFINAAVALDTELSPWDMLSEIKEIELKLGRKERFRWGPREIDIDIALWGNRIIGSGELIVPHEGLDMRDFFLRPLLDIAPSAVNPLSGKPLHELLSGIPDEDRTIISTIEDKRWPYTTI